MDAADLAALGALLKAPAKELVEQIFQQVFAHSKGRAVRPISFPTVLIRKLSEALQINEAETQNLLEAVAVVIDEAVFEGQGPQEVVASFPADFHKSLKQLIAAIVAKNLPSWRETVNASEISLPRLVETDWRIDIKTASDSVARMSAPSVLMEVKVQETPEERDVMPGVRHVTFELNKETLDTMLDGLRRIRDQLSSVTGQAAS